MRYAERKSKQLCPNDTDRQISNAYLYQVENGASVSVNPAKLETLSEIYKIDYSYFLELAGYLSKPSAAIRACYKAIPAFTGKPQKD